MARVRLIKEVDVTKNNATTIVKTMDILSIDIVNHYGRLYNNRGLI